MSELLDMCRRLCEIEWIDQVPPGQVTQLLEAAADALEEMSERAARTA